MREAPSAHVWYWELYLVPLFIFLHSVSLSYLGSSMSLGLTSSFAACLVFFLDGIR